MRITLPTLVGLEILPRSKQDYKNSLLGFLDKTVSPLGPRKLKDILQTPLCDREDILQRQRFVHFLVDTPKTLKTIRENLKSVGDIERILAKISRGKSTPHDLQPYCYRNQNTFLYFRRI